LSNRTTDNHAGLRALAVVLWLAVVTVPALAATRFLPAARTPTPATETLRLPAGAVVPMHIDMDSALVTISPEASVPVRVTRATEIALTDGQPDGRYRFDDGSWHAIKDGVLYLRIDRVRPKLDAGKPEIRMHGDFVFKGEQP
jgi:hypothetical protein